MVAGTPVRDETLAGTLDDLERRGFTAMFAPAGDGLRAAGTPRTFRPEDLDKIEARAQAMLELLDEREQGSTRLPAEEMRTRALSRLVRTYGEVRRMLTYVRWWEGDADEIAPSIWTGRRKASTPVIEEVVVAPVSPALPVLPPPAEPNDGGPLAQ